MPNERTPGQIASRFNDEREAIEKYVRFLHTKTALRDQQVLDLNQILQRVQTKALPVRRYDRASQPFLEPEIEALLAAIEEVGPEVFQTILGHEQWLDHMPATPEDGPAADYAHHLDLWVEFLMDKLSDDPDEDEIEAAIRLASKEAYELDEDSEREVPIEATVALIRAAVPHVTYVKMRQRVSAMEFAMEQFEEIKLLAKVAKQEAGLNVLRQGFILLMTAFDAAVFDIVRMALKKNFFKLISEFGKQDKVSLDTIAEGGSFEGFRDQIIEEQLKKRYVKDLLALLQGLGVKCVDEVNGDKSVRLVEMVLRRNLHVHNRGIVDERYLERDAKGSPRYNLQNLKLGDVAQIDEPYWKDATRRCGYCIDQIARWASQ